MKKTIILSLGVLALASFFYQIKSTEGKHIGIVVPVEHRAMTDMTQGFTERIRNEFASNVTIEIRNAQGDGNIQKALIENFKRKKVDIIVPIGTDVTLMTMSTIKKPAIIGLDITGMVKQSQPNVTGVKESPIEPSYEFIKHLIPGIKKITMVYSASDKNYQMVQTFTELAQADGISIQPIMISSLGDLHVLSHTIDNESDAIFITKDHMVASGAPALSAMAKKLKIPLITSDEGSVISGAAVALGNKETDIGKAGGDIAVKILNGSNPSTIPISAISKYTVFLNSDTARDQGLDVDSVYKTAQLFGYEVKN